MKHDKKKPVVAATGNINTIKKSVLTALNITPKPKIKKERLLETLFSCGQRGLAQPEAYKEYYESCLHSSISDLQCNHGIKFARNPDPKTVKYYGQKPFTRYWLADKNQAIKALELLNAYRAKRNVEPVECSLDIFDKD